LKVANFYSNCSGTPTVARFGKSRIDLPNRFTKEIEMKKLVNVSVLFSTIALLILLVVGTVGASSSLQFGPGEGEIEPEIEPGGGGEGEGEAEPEGEGGELQEAEPAGSALRIDFEVAGHKARGGLYVVQYAGGDVLTTWYARPGWEDSGWLSISNLPRKAVWVEVLYYPGPNTAPTKMRILNHAPGTEYGWVSQGVAHALEVAWPDQPLMYEEAPDFSDRGL
jgi:hypothetical protein